MARIPSGGSAASAPHTQTLFLPAPGTVGFLVTRRGREAAEERREFSSATAAMEWAVESRTDLVFYHGAAPFLN